VLVVEAAQRSGSLITARLAAEQGREVLAVPGSVRNPKARGCHALLREGATLVEEAADVLAELAWSPGPAAPGPDGEGAPQVRDPDHGRVLDAMGWDPVTVDELVERVALTPEALSSILLLLELEGEVCAVGGGCYTRNPRGP
jgi:DNA processing protein